MIIGSCFGIFFSGEDSGTGQTMQTAVQEINTDYQENLDEIKTSHSYDVLEMSGSRAVWKEVLAVYAVKTTTDSDNAQEVATMDDEKLELLKDIFWQMNEISSSTSTQTETVIETSDDGNGNIVETETTVTQTYLYITVSHKTAEEMANQFGFNEDQREQMAELLADENNSLWSQVLYGITGGDGEIVTVALSQVGNVGGEPYWSWYGFGSRVEWCACFVSWCANECGYIEAGVIPKFAACASQ
ncbi:MAG: CHAP domain-containing protein, partial [Eubacterium limosum]|nr:CHAP domain-containing protein [Eubacterium limosum]